MCERSYVGTISQWLKTQPHLPEMTELQVVLFLHSCYYNTESAKITIENYFSAKTNSPLCKSPTEEILTRTLNTLFLGFLPKRTPEDFAVAVIKFLDTDPNKFNCNEYVQTNISTLTLHFLQHGPVNGYVLIVDSQGATFGHLLRTSISAFRQWLHFAQEAAPIRIKGIHLINCVPVTRHFVTLMRPLLKKDIYESIRVHTDFRQTLYEYVPRQCLPEEYGGELASLAEIQKMNKANFVANLGLLQSHDAQVIDETKRLGDRSGGLGARIWGLFR